MAKIKYVVCCYAEFCHKSIDYQCPHKKKHKLDDDCSKTYCI